MARQGGNQISSVILCFERNPPATSFVVSIYVILVDTNHIQMAVIVFVEFVAASVATNCTN